MLLGLSAMALIIACLMAFALVQHIENSRQRVLAKIDYLESKVDDLNKGRLTKITIED